MLLGACLAVSLKLAPEPSWPGRLRTRADKQSVSVCCKVSAFNYKDADPQDILPTPYNEQILLIVA